MKLRWLAVILVALMAASCSRDPDVAKRRYLESGNRYFDRGKYREASMMYRSAIKKDARYGDAYYRLGLSLLKLRDPGGALRSFVRALDLLPSGPSQIDTSGKLTDLYIAGYLADQRRTQAFEVELRDFASRKQVTPFDKLRVEGYILWRRGDLDAALAKFREADALRPMDNNLVLGMTQVLIAKKQYDEANDLAMKLIAKDKEFGAIYDVLYVEYLRRNLLQDAENIRKLKTSNNPKALDYRFQLAAHYYLLNRRDEAASIIKAAVDDTKNFPGAREKAGDFYLMFRNYEKAIEYYKGGLGGTKDEWLTYQRKIADTLIAERRFDEALALIEKEILKQYPKDAVALALRASLWLQMGNTNQVSQAISELETSVNKLPQNAVVRYNLGKAYYTKGDMEQARAQFRAAVDLQPDYVAARQALIEIHISKGEYSQALQLAEETLNYAPTNIAIRMLRAQSLQGIGKNEDARNELQGIIKHSPGSGEAVFRLGLLELNARNYPAAMRTFDECLAQTKNNVLCIIGRAEVLSAQNNFDQALQFLSSELAKAPNDRSLKLALANTSVLAGKFESAISLFSALLSKDPQSSDLHLRLAETYRRMGNNDKAIEHFRRVQQLQPKNPEAAVWLAILLHATGREAEAKHHYEEILQLQPDNAVALNNLAFVIAEQGGDLDLALTYAQRAKQKVPNSDEVSDTLAWIYLKKNLTPNALSIYDDLVKKQPNNNTFRYHRGLALLQKGDKVQAVREFQAALVKNNDAVETQKIREVLGRIN
jgi:tetratricopeptide (TPR) repeat protein